MGLDKCATGLSIDVAVYLGGVTAIGLCFLIAWILVHEEFFGRRYFLATISAMIMWLAFAVAELATPQLHCKVAMASATWPAITFAPIAWCLFMWEFCFNPSKRPPRLFYGLVLLLVFVITAAALTNPVHGLFYGPETRMVFDGGRPSAQFDHGPFFYAAASVLYIFLLIGFVLAVVASFRASRPMRPLMMTLMFGAAVPMAANLGYVLMDVTVFGFDPTPFAFSFVLLALTWAIYSTRGFALGTVARDLLYFNILDPVLVVNAKGIVTDANPATTDLLPQIVPGQALDEASPLQLVRQVARAKAGEAIHSEVCIGERSFNMRILPIARPLGDRGDHLGAVAILSDVTQLKRNNARLADALETTHEQLAEITRLREVAESLALLDPLTGLGNRRALLARIETLGTRPFVMALIDLDHFKRINDDLGHSVGDQVLCEFADIMQSILTPQAEVFRVGGEEFILLIADGTKAEALALLAELQSALEGASPLQDFDHPRLTFSAGIAARTDDGNGFDELYACADDRLYEAKRLGRNLVIYKGSHQGRLYPCPPSKEDYRPRA